MRKKKNKLEESPWIEVLGIGTVVIILLLGWGLKPGSNQAGKAATLPVENPPASKENCVLQWSDYCHKNECSVASVQCDVYCQERTKAGYV